MIALFLIISVALAMCLNLMTARRISRKLVTTIKGIDFGATQVASAARQVAVASQQVADGSSEQAASIEETGLLQPIGITPDYKLVFGERRLRVMKRETIPARIVDVESVLHGQFAENMMRKE